MTRGKMRKYILTNKDREKLLKLLDTDEEDQQTRNLLSQIRKNILRINNDINLILQAIARVYGVAHALGQRARAN